jgi:hypothetical protein
MWVDQVEYQQNWLNMELKHYMVLPQLDFKCKGFNGRGTLLWHTVSWAPVTHSH